MHRSKRVAGLVPTSEGGASDKKCVFVPNSPHPFEELLRVYLSSPRRRRRCRRASYCLHSYCRECASTRCQPVPLPLLLDRPLRRAAVGASRSPARHGVLSPSTARTTARTTASRSLLTSQLRCRGHRRCCTCSGASRDRILCSAPRCAFLRSRCTRRRRERRCRCHCSKACCTPCPPRCS